MADNDQSIEVDSSNNSHDEGDSDSVYGSGLESDTTSLISVAKNHMFENGRRFHGYKPYKYMMPNDEQEQDRMDLQHHHNLLALNGALYTAPIQDKNPQRILDVGTGTGIWCIDIACEFPEAEVSGIDISPIQPNWVPPNVTFEIDDFDEEWTWPDNHFDYIHIRTLVGWTDNWPRLVKQAYRALKPGGYLELQDYDDFFGSDDNSIPPDAPVLLWREYYQEVCTKLGRPWLEVRELFTDLLRAEGAADVTETPVKCPIGLWPKNKKLKEIGMFGRQMKYDGAEAIILATFTRVLGWDVPRVTKFVADVQKDMLNPRYHAHEIFYSIYGRKPEVE